MTMDFSDLFPTPPETDGNQIHKKAHQLWVLAEEVANLLNIEGNTVPYSLTELRILGCAVVLYEFRLLATNSTIEGSNDVINHCLKFPRYHLSKLRSNLFLGVNIDPNRLSSKYRPTHDSGRDDLISQSLEDVNAFLYKRDAFYSNCLAGFYGPKRIVPFKAIYMAFKYPLMPLGEEGDENTYRDKVETMLAQQIVVKLEYIHDTIFEYLIPILNI